MGVGSYSLSKPASFTPRPNRLSTTLFIIETGDLSDLHIAVQYAADVHIRGQSSATFAKKSFAVTLRDAAGKSLPVGLLGMTADEDWVFNGPFADKALMRNSLAYGLSNAAGVYASHTRYVELFVVENIQDAWDRSATPGVTNANGGPYLGIYVLEEKLKRGSKKIDVGKISDDGSLDGFIVRSDKLDPGDHFFTLPASGVGVVANVYPSHPTINQVRDLKWELSFIDRVLFGPCFEDPLIGFEAHLDMDSFVDHFLLVELRYARGLPAALLTTPSFVLSASHNIDGYRWSTYLHKLSKRTSPAAPKLRAGPPWDFNIVSHWHAPNGLTFCLYFTADYIAYCRRLEM